MLDQSQDTKIIDEKLACALCGEEFNSEPFKLECGSIVCKHHYDSVENNELFSCCICGKDHVFEETFDLSYKKNILIPKLKKMISDMKQRLEFYETVSQNPINFLNSQLLELREKTLQRKNDLKQIVKNHYEQSLTKKPTNDLVEVSSLRNQCNKLNNFSIELEKFTDYLKTNQNFYIYHVYGQKLKLIGKILERKIQKLKDDIQTKILESLSIEKTNIPELLADAFGKISIKVNKEKNLLTKDINGLVKVWNLENQTCLYSINIRQCTEYLDILSQGKYLGLLFNEEEKTNILLKIYSYLINEAKINLKNQTVSLSQVLKIKTLEKKIINCLLVVTENAQVVIYDLRMNEQQMPFYELFEDNSLHKEASCLTYLNQDLNLLISCGFTDGNVAFLSISKKNNFFDKLESSYEVPECFKFCFKPHLAPVVYLKFKKFSSNEQSLQKFIFVSASSDGLVRKWTVKCENNFDFELESELSNELFSSCELLNENEIAIGLVNGTVRIMNFDGIQIMEINAHSEKIKCIILNSYGELITGSEDKFIKVWNTKTGSCLSRFISHFDLIESIDLIELNDFRNLIDERRIEAKISQLSIEQVRQKEDYNENHFDDREIK